MMKNNTLHECTTSLNSTKQKGESKKGMLQMNANNYIMQPASSTALLNERSMMKPAPRWPS